MIRAVLEDPTRVPNGDPSKMVKAMIESVDRYPAPKRLVLGSDAYAMLEKALTARLAEVLDQKALASSMDVGLEI